jgi:hypothetical protein
MKSVFHKLLIVNGLPLHGVALYSLNEKPVDSQNLGLGKGNIIMIRMIA